MLWITQEADVGSKSSYLSNFLVTRSEIYALQSPLRRGGGLYLFTREPSVMDGVYVSIQERVNSDSAVSWLCSFDSGRFESMVARTNAPPLGAAISAIIFTNEQPVKQA